MRRSFHSFLVLVFKYDTTLLFILPFGWFKIVCVRYEVSRSDKFRKDKVLSQLSPLEKYYQAFKITEKISEAVCRISRLIKSISEILKINFYCFKKFNINYHFYKRIKAIVLIPGRKKSNKTLGLQVQRGLGKLLFFSGPSCSMCSGCSCIEHMIGLTGDLSFQKEKLCLESFYG